MSHLRRLTGNLIDPARPHQVPRQEFLHAGPDIPVRSLAMGGPRRGSVWGRRSTGRKDCVAVS